MTRDDARRILPIIQSWIDGKTIQVLKEDGSWKDLEEWEIKSPQYRIKPEPREFWLTDCGGIGWTITSIPDLNTKEGWKIMKVREVLE